jgi:hypothetical protein
MNYKSLKKMCDENIFDKEDMYQEVLSNQTSGLLQQTASIQLKTNLKSFCFFQSTDSLFPFFLYRYLILEDNLI